MYLYDPGNGFRLPRMPAEKQKVTLVNYSDQNVRCGLSIFKNRDQINEQAHCGL